MTTEIELIEKLRRIEALFVGATTDGEREAAANALQRMRDRLRQIQEVDPPVEYKFTLSDMWSRKLFVALLRRYEIKPYRYYRQRHTTVMAKVSKKFVDDTLWPEYQELSDILKNYLEDITNRVISEGIHSDSSEAEVVRQIAE